MREPVMLPQQTQNVQPMLREPVMLPQQTQKRPANVGIMLAPLKQQLS